jgi:hypothetical protein
MDYEPRKLAEALVEKHDRFISEKSDEIERMQQAVMLREKRDQLLHWMQENGSKDTYEKELEETERELNQVQGSYTVKNPGHYKKLKDNIDEHKKARDYWLGRMGELTT